MRLIVKFYYFFWIKRFFRPAHKIVQRYLYNARPEKVERFKIMLLEYMAEKENKNGND